MKKYVLSAAYGTPPLFVYEEMPQTEKALLGNLNVSARPYSGPQNIDALGLSSELSEAIENWDSQYQNTFCSSDPKASGFEDPTLERMHHKEGERLCGLLGKHLGESAIIEYRR